MARIGGLWMERPLASKTLAFGLVATLMALTLLLAVRPAHANTFTVNNTNDSGAGSLRQAITDASSSGGSDTINISATGTINLQSALSNLTSMEINGPGASQLTVRRDQGGNYTIFSIFNQTVTLNGLTISNGNQTTFGGGGLYVSSGATLNLNGSVVSGNTASSASSIFGGGISNQGTLVLTNSTVSGNTASSPDPTFGGGIYNSGTLTMTNSTVSTNTVSGHATSTFGGGIYNSGTATMTNSTVSGNTATGSNGTGGLHTNGTVTLTNSTVNNNSAPAGSGVANLYRESGSATFKNTIVANPQAGLNCAGGGITSQGNNLEYPGSTCGFTQPTDKQNQNPLLGTLGNNGGPTQTHALGTNSPAIDAGTNTGCPATDQRGEWRPRDGDNNGSFFCDIGAYEAPGTLQPPANDNFANADTISGPASVSQSSTTAGTTAGASPQAGDPQEFEDQNSTAGHSVWYRWTAPFTGSAVVDTCTTDYDSLLGVYTGSALGSLTVVAANNNNCPSGWGSKVTFNAQAGTTYQIDVDGCCGLPQGTFTLRIDYSPTVSSVKLPRRRSGNVTVQFSESMNPTTLMQNPNTQPSISQTVLLFKGGSTSITQVPAKVSCTDSTCKTVILNPDARLAKRKKYTIRVEGRETRTDSPSETWPATSWPRITSSPSEQKTDKGYRRYVPVCRKRESRGASPVLWRYCLSIVLTATSEQFSRRVGVVS